MAYENLSPEEQARFDEIRGRSLISEEIPPSSPTQAAQLVTPPTTATSTTMSQMFPQVAATSSPVASPRVFTPMGVEESEKQRGFLGFLTGRAGDLRRMNEYNDAMTKAQAVDANNINQTTARMNQLQTLVKMDPGPLKNAAFQTYYSNLDASGQGHSVPQAMRGLMQKINEDEYAGVVMATTAMMEEYFKANPSQDTTEGRTAFQKAIAANAVLQNKVLTDAAGYTKIILENKAKGQDITINDLAIEHAKTNLGGGGGVQSPSSTPLAPPTQPQTPTGQTPPSTTRNQLNTLVAQKAMNMGVDSRLALAILANEGSGTNDVSPKGASGHFQVMPDTARQYLPASMKNATTEQIQAVLKNPEVNHDVGLRLIKDISKKYPNRPDLVMAEYFGGPGAVDTKTMTLKNPHIHDGTPEKPGTTRQQYVDKGMARYNGQAPTTSNTTAPTGNTSSPPPQQGNVQQPSGERGVLQAKLDTSQKIIDQYGPLAGVNKYFKAMVDKAEKDREHFLKRIEALDKQQDRPTSTWFNQAMLELYPGKKVTELTSAESANVNKRAMALETEADNQKQPGRLAAAAAQGQGAVDLKPLDNSEREQLIDTTTGQTPVAGTTNKDVREAKALYEQQLAVWKANPENAGKTPPPPRYATAMKLSPEKLSEVGGYQKAARSLEQIYQAVQDPTYASLLGNLFKNQDGAVERWMADFRGKNPNMSKADYEKYRETAAKIALEVVTFRKTNFGTAVSASEAATANPALPDVNDDPATMKTKIRVLHNRAVNDYNQLISDYSGAEYRVASGHKPLKPIERTTSTISEVLDKAAGGKK